MNNPYLNTDAILLKQSPFSYIIFNYDFPFFKAVFFRLKV